MFAAFLFAYQAKGGRSMSRIAETFQRVTRRVFATSLLSTALLAALAGCASLAASTPHGPAFVDREIDGYLVHLGTDEAVNKACLAQSPLVAPALQGIGVRFLGCALLSTNEAYSIDDRGVIAHELCHLRLQTGSHVLCPPPGREGRSSTSPGGA